MKLNRLRSEIAFPGIVLGLTSLLIVVGGVSWLALAHERAQLQTLLDVTTRGIVAASESFARHDSLEHYVLALGERGLLKRMIVVRVPQCDVVVSNDSSEVGRSLHSLVPSELVARLGVLCERMKPIGSRSLYLDGTAVQSFSLRLIEAESRLPAAAAIAIRIDTGAFGRLGVATFAALFAIACLGTMGSGFLMRRVLIKRVLDPLATIAQSVGARRHDGSSVRISLAHNDEMRDLAESINSTFDTIDAQRRRLQMLATIVEQSPNPVLTASSNGLIQWVNPAAVAMIGTPLELLSGRHVRTLLPRVASVEISARSAWQRVSARRSAAFQALVRASGGGEQLVAVNLYPISDEAENVRLVAIVVEPVGKRREAEREVAQLVTNLQQQIAADLHDHIGGYLGGLSFRLKMLQESLEVGQPGSGSAKEVAALIAGFDDLSSEIRALSHLLTPVGPNVGSLEHALGRLCRAGRLSRGGDCSLSVTGSIPALPQWQAQQVYLIAQEAIRNSLRHGAARRVRVVLSGHDDHLAVQITSRGGRPITEALNGIGRETMAYRADLLQAAFEFRVKSQTIVSVRLIIPVSKRPAPD